ncbi:MAG: NAD-dependent epimerase [Pseudomonadales bacterium]|nr:NAD-dependent epimerase [Pseudomonadales bacterium]
MAILVTGAAGFIGFHVAQQLIARGEEVVGVDNLNDYYDVSLKQSRLKQLAADDTNNLFKFEKIDICDADALAQLLEKNTINSIVHLAAQAGVRFSIENPHAYIEANIKGFMNILELSRQAGVAHLVYASSSSVYGNNEKIPFSTSDLVDHPVSMYAATKKSNELMAHVYSHLYAIPTTGLRFFTVYGPWGRPDMSPFIFAESILNDRPIKLFNEGKHKRDFTYVDDIVDGVIKVLDKPASKCIESGAAYKVYNIGNNDPVALMDYVGTLENALGKKAICEMAPLQPGDVAVTFANIDDLQQEIGYRPDTPLDQGIQKFVDWYKTYFGYS